MNSEIKKYLESADPSFAEGLALFCRYSRNEALMSWISRKRDVEKLRYELEKLSRMNPALNTMGSVMKAKYCHPGLDAGPEKEPETDIVFKTVDERKTRRADLPEELQTVYDTIAEDYKLRRALHEKMKMASTDEDRASFRERIIEANDRIEAGWKEIDEYLLTVEKNKAASDFKESTARSYISKALKKKQLSPANINTIRARYQALLDHGCTVNENTVTELKKRGII